MIGARQLVLDLDAGPRLGRADFLPTPANTAALEAVDGWPDWPDLRMILAGPGGSGRTHLAAIWSADAGAAQLSGHTLRLPDPARAYAVDDADAAAGSAEREEALFHLLNRAAAQRAPVLLTARDTPGTWNVRLPDLKSRLLAFPVTRLDNPDDMLLYMTLVKLGDERQLALDSATLDYLVARMDRSLSTAHRVIDALDRTAISRQKRISRNLAADVLDALQSETVPCP